VFTNWHEDVEVDASWANVGVIKTLWYLDTLGTATYEAKSITEMHQT